MRKCLIAVRNGNWMNKIDGQPPHSSQVELKGVTPLNIRIKGHVRTS